MHNQSNSSREMKSSTDSGVCQLYSVPKLATGYSAQPNQSLTAYIKSGLAVPWNLYVKKWIKKYYYKFISAQGEAPFQAASKVFAPVVAFQKGDLVRVRSVSDIRSTLDPFRELRGCSFLPAMQQYCDTEQRVFKVMKRFVDERDYKPKKTKGIILLENVVCEGTPLYGDCDRCCFLFWREEWLEKI
jgi:hypothetical protein